MLVRGSQPPADSKSDPRTTQHLWRVPLAGGKPTEIELGHSDFGDVRLSPDGRGLAFIAGKVAAELWVLDDPHLGFGTAGHDGARRK